MFAIILAAALVLPARQSDAIIGVAAVHLETGRTVSIRGGERFPMGSVYKFPIGLTTLRAIDDGALSISQKVLVAPADMAGGWSPLRDEANGGSIEKTIGELLEAMVSMSDNTASDVLLRLCGGPLEVTRRMQDLGAPDVRVDRSEKEIHADLETEGGAARYATDPRDTTTPEAMAGLLVDFWNGRDGLSSGAHALLMHHMTESPTGERKLRAGAPAGWVVAHKSGMMPGVSNDVGILTSPDGKQHIAIAIFAKGVKDDGYKIADADIAAITHAVVTALAQ